MKSCADGIKPWICSLLLFWGVTSGWSDQSKQEAQKEAPPAKEIVQLLLQHLDLPLAIHPSCSGVGSDFDDKTLRDFLSGLIANQTGPQGRNWVETFAVAKNEEAEKDRLWECTVIFRRQNGEEEWGWGVRFSIKALDRSFVMESVRCLGSG